MLQNFIEAIGRGCDVQSYVSDLQYNLREKGILTNVTYTLTTDGKIISFTVKITGFYD